MKSRRSKGKVAVKVAGGMRGFKLRRPGIFRAEEILQLRTAMSEEEAYMPIARRKS